MNTADAEDMSPPGPLMEAATLVPVFEQDGVTQVILTRRTDTVKHHKGQICFPGGVRDEDDLTLWHTALRETREEIGLVADMITYICTLPAVVTPTAFHVTPFVARVASTRGLVPNPDEIAEVFSVPLKHLQDPQYLRFEPREYFGQSFPVPFFRYGPHEIWGATGRMLLSLVSRWPEIERKI